MEYNRVCKSAIFSREFSLTPRREFTKRILNLSYERTYLLSEANSLQIISHRAPAKRRRRELNNFMRFLLVSPRAILRETTTVPLSGKNNYATGRDGGRRGGWMRKRKRKRVRNECREDKPPAVRAPRVTRAATLRVADAFFSLPFGRSAKAIYARSATRKFKVIAVDRGFRPAVEVDSDFFPVSFAREVYF